MELLPVAVGGFLALIGGVVTQFFIARFNRAKERGAVLREKGEEAVMLLLQYQNWVNAQSVPSLRGGTENPFLKAQALQKLYFGSLDSKLENMANLGSALLQELGKLEGRKDAVGNLSIEISPQGHKLLIEHHSAMNAIVEDICSIVRRNL